MLELRNATKRYGRLEVLHETRLAVRRGELWTHDAGFLAISGLRLHELLWIMRSAS